MPAQVPAAGFAARHPDIESVGRACDGEYAGAPPHTSRAGPSHPGTICGIILGRRGSLGGSFSRVAPFFGESVLVTHPPLAARLSPLGGGQLDPDPPPLLGSSRTARWPMTPASVVWQVPWHTEPPSGGSFSVRSRSGWRGPQWEPDENSAAPQRPPLASRLLPARRLQIEIVQVVQRKRAAGGGDRLCAD